MHDGGPRRHDRPKKDVEERLQSMVTGDVAVSGVSEAFGRDMPPSPSPSPTLLAAAVGCT
jgi:hypothetical protein